LPSVQLFFLCSALVILPLAWMKGGHAERAAVALLVAAYVSGPFLQDIRVGRVLVVLALGDVIVWAVFVWLSLKHDRWWLLLATAAQSLNVLSHVALVLTPSLTARENVAAQWVFGLVSLYALLLGIAERRLAGERPAAPPLDRRSIAQS